jgi:uncharacterized lipoprotein YddW (UPF0748 family)
MIKFFLLFLTIFSQFLLSQPKSEVRAVWLTTVHRLDWPTNSGITTQQAELRQILDQLKAANFNTIFLQVRSRGGVLYPSAIEPWATALTQTLGGNPGYDPLQFAIDEAHKRGFEIHAWWNVYHSHTAVNSPTPPPVTNPPHIVHSNPNLVRLYPYVKDGVQYYDFWLDPGFPESRNYLLNLAMEMVRKYNIDGIHFDYIRYPDPSFSDDSTFQLYGAGQIKSNWRRNNVTQFVSAIYDSIQAVKPMLKVGSAPIGIYQDLSPCNSGWDGFTQVFQDSRRWLLLKKHDYLSPQIYHNINDCPRFDSLAINWISNSFDRHIYPGIAVYRMGASDGNWTLSEITAQIDSSRKFGGKGQTYYRTGSFKSNQKGIRDHLQNNQYKYPANIPPMPWKDNIKPNAPVNISLTTTDSLAFTLTWSKPSPAQDGDTAVYYNVFRDNQFPVDINDITKMIKFRMVNDTSLVILFDTIPTSNHYFAVTAFDKGYNESSPAETGIIIVSNDDENYILSQYFLSQNYPNPFNPSTVINYSIPVAGPTTLKIYDVLGNELAALINEHVPAGNHTVTFDASAFSSGVYFYKLSSGAYVSTKKMLLVK